MQIEQSSVLLGNAVGQRPAVEGCSLGEVLHAAHSLAEWLTLPETALGETHGCRQDAGRMHDKRPGWGQVRTASATLAACVLLHPCPQLPPAFWVKSSVLSLASSDLQWAFLTELSLRGSASVPLRAREQPFSVLLAMSGLSSAVLRNMSRQHVQEEAWLCSRAGES